jgi:hypothetical protein
MDNTTGSVNSTANYNTTSTVKADNGFCILTTTQRGDTESFLKNFIALAFDAVPAIGIQRSANVTSHSVESGKQISDHVQIRNNQFSMSGLITETPIRLTLDSLANAGEGNRISQAIEYLDQIFDARQPIKLLTPDRTYDSVILKNISYNYTTEMQMKFDLQFEQIRLVSGAQTNVIATKCQPTKSTGKKTKKKTENAAPSAGQTSNPDYSLQPTLDTAK